MEPEQLVSQNNEHVMLQSKIQLQFKNPYSQFNSTKDKRYENLRRSVMAVQNSLFKDRPQVVNDNLLKQFQEQLDIVKGQSYLDISEQEQQKRTEVLNDMMAAKNQIIEDIEHYFDDLFYQFVKDRPSQILQKKLEQQIVSKMEQINYLKSVHDNQLEQFNAIDLVGCLEDVKAKVQEIDETLNNLQQQPDMKEEYNCSENKVKLMTNKSIFNKIKNLLPELAYIDINSNQQNQSKLDITQPSYFQSSQIHEKVLAVINDEKNTLVLYNDGLQQQKTMKLYMNQDQKIPYQHSLIVTPDSNIYISGGVEIESGIILNSTYLFDSENVTLKQIQNMLVKRIGHQLVYVDNCIYAIGGKTDDQVCTKLCERFNISLFEWEDIESMNYARTRCGVTKFNATNGETFIYAFFGTDTMKLTNQSIERYSITFNKWEVVNLKFHMKRLETSGLGCQQINQNEIILFGGFYQEQDRLSKKEQIVFSSKIGIFNTNSCTIKMSSFDIPIDFYNTNNSQCILQDNKLLAIGHFMQQKSPQLMRCLDVDYVLSIDSEKAQIEAVLDEIDITEK